MRRALPRGSALGAVAAELLAYLDAAPQSAAAIARETAPDAPWQLPLPSEPDAPRTEEIMWRTDADSAADMTVRELGQAAQTAFLPADPQTPEPEPDAVRRTVRLSASAGRQQTMDDISEFFRRDSRRYDNGFAGGNGI